MASQLHHHEDGGCPDPKEQNKMCLDKCILLSPSEFTHFAHDVQTPKVDKHVKMQIESVPLLSQGRAAIRCYYAIVAVTFIASPIIIMRRAQFSSTPERRLR